MNETQPPLYRLALCWPFVLLAYWRRNTSARHAYLYVLYLVLGLACAAVAVMRFNDPSVSRWP